jgi:hypothetical protein
MTLDTLTNITPRAWVGCLACYSGGRLVGEWLDADGLEDPDALEAICRNPEHEELWCFDIDNLPGGECSPAEAAARARAVLRVIDQAEERGCPADVALEYVEDSNITDPDCWPDIEDAYAGSCENETDYVFEYLENSAIELPGWLHVDYRGSFEELTMGMTRIRRPGVWHLFYN